MGLSAQVEHSRISRRHGSKQAAVSTATLTNCPLCGTSNTDHAFRDSGCELRVCNICGLFFVHPYPASTYQHAQVSSGKCPAIELLDCGRRYQGERLFYDRHFSAIADECQDAASILDVGCGTGHLLERFAGRPRMHRLGIELNPQAAKYARQKAGCDIREVPFEHFRSDRQFDVITMINVFSHIPSFDGMFRSLASALRPGGKVILRTSEMGRHVSRWNQVHWGIPDDLHFLGLQTIDFICARYGFVAVRHIQTAYEDELFRKSRWEQTGRSRLRNLAKTAGLHIPGALSGLRKLYAAALGRRLFVSLIVLKPLAEAGAPHEQPAKRSTGQANIGIGGAHTYGSQTK